MSHRGLLLTMTEPPAAMEEEFNAWCDDEHLPERLGITGFRSARRWVADVPAGEGKYLATYEYMVASESPIQGLSLPSALQVRSFTASVGTPPPVALAELAWDGTRNVPPPQAGWFIRLYRANGA
jgi:hypothetical protein